MIEKVWWFFFVDVVCLFLFSDMVYIVLKKRVGSWWCWGCGMWGFGCIFELFFEVEIVYICWDYLIFFFCGFVNIFEFCGYEGVVYSLK